MAEIKTDQQKDQQLVTIRDGLAKQKTMIQQALPNFLNTERFMVLAYTAIQRQPKLQEAWLPSLYGAVIKSAQLGLEIDDILGHAHLVPFKNTRANRTDVVLIPGYRGLMMLAHRSRLVSTIDAHTVWKGDEFDYAYGSKAFLTHRPGWGRRHALDTGETDIESILGFYAIARLRDGSALFTVLSTEEAKEIAKRFSRSFQQEPDSSPWLLHFDAMGEKSALRDLCSRRLPASSLLLEAANLDMRAAAGTPVILTPDEAGVWGADGDGHGHGHEPGNGQGNGRTEKPSGTKFMNGVKDSLRQQATGQGSPPATSPTTAPAPSGPAPAAQGSAGPGGATQPATATAPGNPGVERAAGTSATRSEPIPCPHVGCKAVKDTREEMEDHFQRNHPVQRGKGSRSRPHTSQPAPFEGTRRGNGGGQGNGPLLPGETPGTGGAPTLDQEFERVQGRINAAPNNDELEKIKTEILLKGGLFSRLVLADGKPDQARRTLIASAIMAKAATFAG